MLHGLKARGGRIALAAALLCAAVPFGGTAIADVLFTESPPTTGVKRVYREVVAKHSSAPVHVEGASTANGARVVQWGRHDAMHGQWERLPVAGQVSQYVFRSRWGRQCMDVAADSTATGAAVVQRPCDGSPSQRWRQFFGPLAAGSAFQNALSGKYLTVAGASTANGAGLIQWPYVAGAQNQRFDVPVVSSPVE